MYFCEISVDTVRRAVVTFNEWGKWNTFYEMVDGRFANVYADENGEIDKEKDFGSRRGTFENAAGTAADCWQFRHSNRLLVYGFDTMGLCKNRSVYPSGYLDVNIIWRAVEGAAVKDGWWSTGQLIEIEGLPYNGLVPPYWPVVTVVKGDGPKHEAHRTVGDLVRAIREAEGEEEEPGEYFEGLAL